MDSSAWAASPRAKRPNTSCVTCPLTGCGHDLACLGQHRRPVVRHQLDGCSLDDLPQTGREAAMTSEELPPRPQPQNLDDWKAELLFKMTEACADVSKQEKNKLLDFLEAMIERLRRE